MEIEKFVEARRQSSPVNRLGRGYRVGKRCARRALEDLDPLLPTIFSDKLYSVEQEWFDGGEQDLAVFGVDGFFTSLFDRLQFKNNLRLTKAAPSYLPRWMRPFLLNTLVILRGIRRSVRS